MPKISELPARASPALTDQLVLLPSGGSAERATLTALRNLLAENPRTSTWAGLPSAASASGHVYLVTDLGPGGSLFRSDGTRWQALHPITLGRGSSAAALHTGNTTETTFATVTVPAGLLGPSGFVRITHGWAFSGSNNKTPRVKFGGTTFRAPVISTSTRWHDEFAIRNDGEVNAQVGMTSLDVQSYGQSTQAFVAGAIDTAAAADLTFTGQLTNSGDGIRLRFFDVVAVP